MRSANRQAAIQELRHQLRYASTPEERETLRNRLDFWLNYFPRH